MGNDEWNTAAFERGMLVIYVMLCEAEMYNCHNRRLKCSICWIYSLNQIIKKLEPNRFLNHCVYVRVCVCVSVCRCMKLFNCRNVFRSWIAYVMMHVVECQCVRNY